MPVDLAWPFLPQDDVVETLEWHTNIHTCRKAEYRRCKRPVPRVGYRYKYVMDFSDYGIARERFRSLSGLTQVLVPDWPNAVQIPSIGPGTASLPVDATGVPALRTDAYVLIVSSNSLYEVSQISSVGSGVITINPATTRSYSTPWIVPTRLGRFVQDLVGNQGPDGDVEVGVEFDTTDGEDLFSVGGGIGYPTYLGYPVVTDPIEVINSVQESTQREAEVVDSKTGRVFVRNRFSTAKRLGILAWTALDADFLWSLRVWLHTRRGRWKQFWTSSWNADITITRDINGGDSTIEIAAIDFANKYPFPCDFAIVSPDGGIWAIRVTAAASGAPGKELLTLSAPFSGAVTLAGIDQTCRLTLSRLDSDRIDIQHLPGRQATVVVAVKEVPIYP